MAPRRFLTDRALALLLIAQDPDVRLRDIAVALDVTNRTAYGLVSDLISDGCVVKGKRGRRNHYDLQAHRLLYSPTSRSFTVGEFIGFFSATSASGPDSPPAS